MKVLAIFLILFLVSSCRNEEKTSLCYAYDSNNRLVDCETNVSANECIRRDTNKANGYRWEYEEIDGANAICPPASPVR